MERLPDLVGSHIKSFLLGQNSRSRFCLRGPRAQAKKPLTRVSKRVPGVHGKRGLERGWQKRLAEKVGEGLAKGCTGLTHRGTRVVGVNLIFTNPVY